MAVYIVIIAVHRRYTLISHTHTHTCQQTTHLASLMMNRGELIALDHSAKKVASLMELFKELGFTFAKAYHMDAARAVLPKESNQIASSLTANDDKVTTIGSEEAEVAVREEEEDSAAVEKKEEGTSNNEDEDSSSLQKTNQSRQLRKDRVAAARAKGKTGPKSKAQSTFKTKPSTIKVEKIAGFEPESFDAILLDPPCSALGLR
jgi:hypothetical protein